MDIPYLNCLPVLTRYQGWKINAKAVNSWSSCSVIVSVHTVSTYNDPVMISCANFMAATAFLENIYGH